MREEDRAAPSAPAPCVPTPCMGRVEGMHLLAVRTTVWVVCCRETTEAWRLGPEGDTGATR